MFESHNILAVDDEGKVLDSLKRVFLDEQRITLITTTDPQEALQIAVTRDIDLIIADQQMPGMTGIELLERVIQKKPDIITIVLTGYSDVKVILKAVNDIGVYKFILKPWKNDDLYWTVVRALEMKELVENNRHLNCELKKRDAYLRELESRNPGITKVKRDSSGAVIIDDI